MGNVLIVLKEENHLLKNILKLQKSGIRLKMEKSPQIIFLTVVLKSIGGFAVSIPTMNGRQLHKTVV